MQRYKRSSTAEASVSQAADCQWTGNLAASDAIAVFLNLAEKALQPLLATFIFARDACNAAEEAPYVDYWHVG